MLALLLLLTPQTPPSSELPPDLLALVRIKQKMAKNLKNLPDFTCLETLERSRRTGTDEPFAVVDNMRLDVLFTGNRELYSWPGARKFDEMEPQMKGSGLSSNGEFAAHAQNVFVNNTAEIHFQGEEDWRGRRALKYSFRIPLMYSGWRMTSGGASGTVASRGAFWADPVSYEVLRLEFAADDIPPSLPIRSTSVGIEYGRLRIATADILAPQTAELVVTQLTGAESRNSMDFSQCRQYHAESAIRFEDAPAAETAVIQEVELPANLILKLQLDTAIDSDKAAQGDLITAHLTVAADLKGKVFVPQGALVRGRIRRLERYPGTDGKPFLVVGLEFSEIESSNQRAAFLGKLDQMDTIPGRILTERPAERPSASKSMAAGGSLLGQARELKTQESIRVVNVRDLELPGVGTFAVDGRRLQLAAGFHMTWKTVSLAREAH